MRQRGNGAMSTWPYLRCGTTMTVYCLYNPDHLNLTCPAISDQICGRRTPSIRVHVRGETGLSCKAAHVAVGEGEMRVYRMVSPQADILARPELCATLPDDDVARKNLLPPCAWEPRVSVRREDGGGGGGPLSAAGVQGASRGCPTVFLHTQHLGLRRAPVG